MHGSQVSNTRSSRVVVSFSIGLQVARATCEIINPSSGGTIASTLKALSKERTGDSLDVMRVLVKFSTLTKWNTRVGQLMVEHGLRTKRETRRIEGSCRMRWPHPAVFDWDRDKASSQDGQEAHQWYDGGNTVEKVSRER